MPLRLLCTLLIALPWVWPFTAGPAAALVPYLASAGFSALLLALWPAGERKHDGGPATASAAAIVAWGWASAALLSAVIALLQYLDLETALYPAVNIAQPGQAFGNLRQPNQLATLLVLGLLSVRWLAQSAHLAARYALGMAGLLLVALAATASRIGLAELLVLGAVALWWTRRRPGLGTRVLWAMAALAVYAVAALALPALLESTEGVSGRAMLERLRSTESTCGSRLILWRNVLHLISLKPWLGWGWGELDYAHYITLYDGARFCYILDNAHNLPLHLAVELGVPVAVLVTGLIAWAIWRARPWHETDPTRQLAWAVLGAIGLHSLVEYPLWYGPFQMAVALSLYLLWPRPSALRRHGLSHPHFFWRQAIAVAILACVTYVGWDYHRISQLFLPVEQRAAAYRFTAQAHAQRSWLFADVVRFADVTTRPVTRETAPSLLPAALKALHYSPEPRTAIKLIESASLLGQDDLALAHMARFRAAFPKEYEAWASPPQPSRTRRRGPTP